MDDEEDIVTAALADEDAQAPEPDDEMEDYEVEPGKTRKIQKWAKPMMMMDKDYRQKTQVLGKDRRELEAQQKTFRETQQTHQKFISDVSKYQAVESDLVEYNRVDWNAYRAQDKDAADNAWFNFQQLEKRRGTMARDINQKISRDRAFEKAEMEKARAQFEIDAQHKIKGWSPEKRASINKVLMEEYGYSQQDVDDNIDVRAMRLAADAAWLREIRQKAKDKSTAPIARPVTQLSGAAAASQAISDRDSTAAWMAKRNAADAKRRRA